MHQSRKSPKAPNSPKFSEAIPIETATLTALETVETANVLVLASVEMEATAAAAAKEVNSRCMDLRSSKVEVEALATSFKSWLGNLQAAQEMRPARKVNIMISCCLSAF